MPGAVSLLVIFEFFRVTMIVQFHFELGVNKLDSLVVSS